MRRVLAIGLAIIIVTLGARGAVAQDSQTDVSERLLEILKDRQIISDDEYGELKTLARPPSHKSSSVGTRDNTLGSKSGTSRGLGSECERKTRLDVRPANGSERM